MKRILIILASVAVLIFLIVRMIVVSSNRQDDAQRDFVSKLDYDLSLRVDSVGLFNEYAPVGFLTVKVTRGNYENKEKRVGRNLKKDRRVRFLIDHEDGIQFFSKDANQFKVGDSLVVNSAEDRLSVFRDGEKVFEHVISKNLSGGHR